MTWEDIFKEERKKEYYFKLRDFLLEEDKNKIILPSKENRLNAFKLTPFEDVKVVILGQDPYHNLNQAHGLSFSVLTKDYPKSLLNIFKELTDDLDISYPSTGDLTKWAKEGVLLLNTILTVEIHKPLSHKDRGWEELTKSVILALNKKEGKIVYILWGANARSYKKYIDTNKHLVIESVHPSPLSAHNGFFKSKPFSKTNEFLIKNNIKPIDFSL
ncbi:uracil-DNA glycosylase [Acholeplasma sp. OttesenSCG-928-E16]|nr:uracil-DNA glycosylase [Acholeplasma sp. OttesenSCG-928-E16]